MSEFPKILYPLHDSEQAVAIVKVHPKTLQRHARNGLVIGVRVVDVLPHLKEGDSRHRD